MPGLDFFPRNLGSRSIHLGRTCQLVDLESVVLEFVALVYLNLNP